MGLICGGVCIRWVICITKSIGLAYSWKNCKKLCATIQILLCCILYLKAISKASRQRGDLMAGFLSVTSLGG